MLRRVLALALPLALLVAPAASGAPVAEVVPFETKGRDGTPLQGHVYLPEGSRPFATVLELSPYWGGAKAATESQSDGEGRLSEEMQPFIDAGFAVAFVSMRGSGRSGGCLSFGAEEDRTDAYEIIQGLAAQRWSNGSIGMYGLSYDGWSQFLAMAAAPPALKATIPGSGVIDLWSLLGRRGAPLFVAGPAFTPLWTALTSAGSIHQGGAQRLGCPDAVTHIRENADLGVTGNRTKWFEDRDLRPLLKESRVPALVTNGMATLRAPLTDQEGHVLQFEGLWDILSPDRTRFVLGQWGHQPAYLDRDDFLKMSVAWMDHYLRGGPQTVKPGVVEYQQLGGQWKSATSWPPPSRTLPLKLSKERLVPEGAQVESSETRFQSTDNDPGLRVDTEETGGRYATSTCGPNQATYVSAPMPEDVELAGNFQVELTLSSTQPGGHFAVLLHRTKNDGSCPDRESVEVGRALLDLRHWRTAGRAEDFPTGKPTTFTFTSHPTAAKVLKGERLVAAIGGGAWEIASDPLKPLLTVHTGRGIAGRITLPIVTGELPDRRTDAADRSVSVELPPASSSPRSSNASRKCVSRRRFRIRLRAPGGDRIESATVSVDGKPRRTVRGPRRTATVDLRKLPRGRFSVSVSVRTVSGRRAREKRRYRTCTPKPRRGRQRP
ncbi:MAG: hypothetical protein AVDCRST_MAG85-3392 [uncultured Solirubrobacteraceae bacterium]|uniref:Xaa-Pro dipeptidyl-peptidase C-terminal domain-containing protein n=1 Tax=uncultured Solirubrobacteraceae bacterium TaxID=1162706 RepID=A0A6J4TP10_9ACTN|nr:MAG: hypothetical protein AVDCRST_MAG85-3392 [uncultured Solirubrobacteraceae bacterium]